MGAIDPIGGNLLPFRHPGGGAHHRHQLILHRDSQNGEAAVLVVEDHILHGALQVLQLFFFHLLTPHRQKYCFSNYSIKLPRSPGTW